MAEDARGGEPASRPLAMFRGAGELSFYRIHQEFADFGETAVCCREEPGTSEGVG